MLRYIGHTSPECHLIPGEPLNLEAGTPEGFSTESEEAIKGMVIHQKVNELQYYSKHKMDQGSVHSTLTSPFNSYWSLRESFYDNPLTPTIQIYLAECL